MMGMESRMGCLNYRAEPLEPRVMLAASMVQDLNITSSGSSISALGHLGNVAVFSENDGVHGIEPYRSDGTRAGTFRLRDINPGGGDSDTGFLATIGKTMFLSATDGKAVALWKTDGTVAGTVKIANVTPTNSEVVVGSELFFV